jgi:hypothetical protein
VSYVSQVHYVDGEHVALTYQFFSKTRENVLANPRATLFLVNPTTLARYRLAAEYLRTETDGPLFESMKAKLAGIASHTGMSGVSGCSARRSCVLGIEVLPQALPARRRGAACLRRCARRRNASPRAPISPVCSTNRSNASRSSSGSSMRWC